MYRELGDRRKHSEERENIITDDNEVENYKKIEEEYGNVFHLLINPVTQEQVMMQGEETPDALKNSTTIIERVTLIS